MTHWIVGIIVLCGGLVPLASHAAERATTTVLLRYTTTPVRAVIYLDVGAVVPVANASTLAAKELCPIIRRDPVAFPVQWEVRWPRLLPDGSVNYDEAQTATGTLEDCVARPDM